MDERELSIGTGRASQAPTLCRTPDQDAEGLRIMSCRLDAAVWTCRRLAFDQLGIPYGDHGERTKGWKHPFVDKSFWEVAEPPMPYPMSHPRVCLLHTAASLKPV